MYASPSAQDRSRMERLINKLKRNSFLPVSATSAAALAGEADQRLFRAVISDQWRFYIGVRGAKPLPTHEKGRI